MKRPAILVAAAAAACATSGPRVPEDTFSYSDAPSPAVYHIADTLVADVRSLLGSLQAVSASTFTMGLTFAADPGGVRVTGAVESLEATIDTPMTSAETLGIDDVSGTLGFLMGPSDVLEVTSFPEVGAPSPMFTFPTLPYLLFPRLVPGVVLPGATWVDTVTASYEGEVSASFTTVIDHTFVGDTVADGRPLLHIAVAARVAIELKANGEELLSDQAIEGTSNGFALWDPERKLVAYAWFDRDLEADVTIAGMPRIPVEIAGTTVLRLGG